tara:strand:+ start:1980 stop:2213 length:234 start_codon:yes stop_codon:yes gene_type:complete
MIMSEQKLNLKEIEHELDLLYDNAGSEAINNDKMMEIYEGGYEFMYEEYKRKRLWHMAQRDAFDLALNLFRNMRDDK